MISNEFYREQELERQKQINVDLPNLIHRILHSAMYSLKDDKDLVNFYISQIKKITNAECESALDFLEKNVTKASQ